MTMKVIKFNGECSDPFNEGKKMTFIGYCAQNMEICRNSIIAYYDKCTFQIEGYINLSDKCADYFDREAYKFYLCSENRNKLFLFEEDSDGVSSGRQPSCDKE